MNIELKAPGGFSVEVKDIQIKKTEFNFHKRIDTSQTGELKNKFQNTFNPSKRIENLYSTYKERLDHVPKEVSENGKWIGERGESKFIPFDKTIKTTLEKYGTDGIEYQRGIPDFSSVSVSTVQIEHMTEKRYGENGNFVQCDSKCAEKWNIEAKDGKKDWTARDVANFRLENQYSWHERNDMKTCDLVPSNIHQVCTHLGGVAECKKRDNLNGVDFDA